MSEEKISVRQWQERFRAGEYSSKDVGVQCAAGWYDWFCRDEALAGRLKKIAKVVMGITDPFILDNYYVWFKNNCPVSGPMYDDVRFEPLSGDRDGKYFVVCLDCPHENKKWALITDRYDLDVAEFECDNVRDMVKYINGMGRELEQDTVPAFIAEKNAVMLYALRHDESCNIRIFRNGDHKFSYRSSKDRGIRNVMVAASPEDGPEGFVAEQAEKVKGLYIYCPEEAAVPRDKAKSPRRKGQER